MEYKEMIVVRFLNLENMINQDVEFHSEIVARNEQDIRVNEPLEQNRARELHIYVLQRMNSKCRNQVTLAKEYLAGLNHRLEEVRAIEDYTFLTDGQIKVMQEILAEYETKSFCEYRKSSD